MGKKKGGENKTKGIFKRDILDPEKRPEEFEILKDKIWWGADKSLKYFPNYSAMMQKTP